jgi:hypothetical protein
VLKRRAPRIAVTGFLLAIAVSGLTACRTSPSVAAYVGDAQVTVAELDAAVAERLSDPDIAAYAEGAEAEFTRDVLDRLVDEEVYAAAAEQYDVRVTDAQVRSRIDELLGDDDPDAVYAQLAQQGISREDVFENVRQQLLRQEIALAEGEVEEPSEEDLRARYEEVKADQTKYRFGYITVPDQATADDVEAQLEASPTSYADVAGQYAGQYTLPALTDQAIEQVPGPLAEQVAAAAPNTAFSVPVAEVGGIVVTFVEGPVYPTFEELLPQLEQEAIAAGDDAGTALVDEVRKDLDVTVNPRYGPGDGGVVDILDILDDGTGN